MGTLAGWFLSSDNYHVTRFLLQRAIALVYLIAFWVAVKQFVPLLGDRGLLPVKDFVSRVGFMDGPSLFHYVGGDRVYRAVAWLGTLLSLLALTGISERFGFWVSAGTWFVLWMLYLSIVNVGQTFYSFGWESLLLECGFLTIFSGDVRTPASPVIIWMYRWVLFRLMFGAGLIKLRGDTCWRDLTCLVYHYETQPMPNPLSWYFHHMPVWFHKSGVLINHFTEIIVPFFYFIPGPLAAIAGILTIGFQGMLMVSGNFAFLNFLTIMIAIATFSDRWFIWLVPFLAMPAAAAGGVVYPAILSVLVVMVILLSIKPLVNLISPYQMMNTSYDPFHLVNSYGAFGTITRPRYEVILEGTADEKVNDKTKWLEYEFPGKPGDVNFMPRQFAPYHLRLGWLMWFAAFGTPQQHPWIVKLVEKLLEGDPQTITLVRLNPFSNMPPKVIRAKLFEYHFTSNAEHAKSGAWWSRSYQRDYLPMLTLENGHLIVPVAQKETGK